MSTIEVTVVGPTDPASLKAATEEEIALFEAFFTSSAGGLGNDPLIGPEKALLRTYLLARVSGRIPSPLKEKETSQA